MDPHRLQRFVDAQEPVIREVYDELRAGRKESHWMWFIFPQIKGLGNSHMAERYAIASLAEASAYSQHPVLGARLLECARLVVAVEGRPIGQILGAPDDLKFRSSMTLFAAAAPTERIFAQALEKYFGGVPDPLTLPLIRPARR
jgi:uncharacterized protein (DUF1810 family)